MKKYSILVIIGIFIASTTFSQENKQSPVFLQNTSISGEWFLGFGYDTKSDISSFRLKRGYFTIKTRLNDIFSVRYTQDITTDREGGDMGNVEMRLKYLLLKVKLDRIELLKNSYLEFGLVHRPWLEYEQKITGYRVQGKMYSDRYNLVTSADFGVSFAGLLGGEIDEGFQEKVSSDFPGRYGSFSFGVYNGGGYHALERNNNKIIEGRVSLRPLPDVVPGMQFTYTFSYGKSNTITNNSRYKLNIFHLSTISRYHKFMIQYYSGIGGFDDSYVDSEGRSYNNNGYSAFGELMIPGTRFAVFSRYDRLISDQDVQLEMETIIAGITYRFLKNKVLLNYDYSELNGGSFNLFELALEINF